jgi:Spx/MgsR family transcriptional regulator
VNNRKISRIVPYLFKITAGRAVAWPGYLLYVRQAVCRFSMAKQILCVQNFYFYGMKVYGIPNCNTVKKALDWLKENHVNYEFHDFKKLGISPEKLKEWDKKAGYETFLNKKGTTWKGLDEETKESIRNSDDALNLLRDKTSMIKRPVIEDGDFLFFGFDEEIYRRALIK